MKIDLTCPAEVLQIQLPAEENRNIVLFLFNLAERRIVSCEATVRLLDSEGEEVGRAVHRARALDGRPHTAFSMTVPQEKNAAASRAEATVDKVWFDDNDVWRRDPSREKEYTDNRLPVSPALSALRFAAGEGAVGFPSQQDGLWVCVCGRPNSDKQLFCSRCRRQKEAVFAQCSREAVETLVYRRERQLDLKTRSAREDTARLQHLREQEYNQQQVRRERVRHLLTSLAAALLLFAVTFFGIFPGLRLWSGTLSMNGGRLEEAEAVLTELGSFPGAESALRECRLRIARRDALESGDTDKLSAAASVLRTLGSDDDRSLADRTDFRRAGILLDRGDTDGAGSLLSSLPADYPGLKEENNAVAYRLAENKKEKKLYASARLAFLALGSYGDAKKQADSCLYEPALHLIESQDYDAAASLLEQIPDYEDSAELIRKCRYLKGSVLERAGRSSDAKAAYLLSGNYEDAAEKIASITRAEADSAKESGNYAAAMALYASLGSAGDAEDQYLECALTLAEQAYRDKNHQQAAELLRDAPETEATAKLLSGIRLAWAEELAADGQYEEAAALLSLLGDDPDGQKLLKQIQTKLPTPVPAEMPEETPAPVESTAPQGAEQ